MIKAGRVVVEDGEIREVPEGKTLHVAPSYDPGAEEDIRHWFEECYSVSYRNYPVADDCLHAHEQIACE